jgi:O-methyltransferase
MSRLRNILIRFVDFLDRKAENRFSEAGMVSQAFHFAKINDVRGDYFEFGLWEGNTFMAALRCKAKFRMPSVMLWGFDSFEGLPDVSRSPDELWKKGQFSCSEKRFRDIVKENGFSGRDFQLVRGFYDQSLNADLQIRMAGRKAMAIYVDCDLYESTRDVLRFLPPYLQNGTVICFDDYYCYKADPERGEQKAIREFLEQCPGITLLPYMDYGPVGKSFIVRMK